MTTTLGVVCDTAPATAATWASGVYDASAASSRASTSPTPASASCRAASPPPATSTAIGSPAASCCAQATASQLARLSAPARCSATTRIIAPSRSQNPRLLAQAAHEFRRGLGRRAVDHRRLLRLGGQRQPDDLETGGEAGGGRHAADLLLL